MKHIGVIAMSVILLVGPCVAVLEGAEQCAGSCARDYDDCATLCDGNCYGCNHCCRPDDCGHPSFCHMRHQTKER
jgi:hypothetical protein